MHRIFTRVFQHALIGATTAVLLTAGVSRAEEPKYPNKPIKVVVAYAPGATDIAVRPFTEKLSAYFGQPFMFDYKPGAAGAIGASFVAKSKPDGYTIFVTSHGPLINPYIKDNIDYTIDDFVPIARMVRSPYGLWVKGDSRWKTLKDLVDEAKKNPGQVSLGTAGVLSMPFVTAYAFMKSAGIKANHIPMQGDTPAITGLLGGHIDLAVTTLIPASPHIRSGGLRPLVVFEKERLKEFPDIPTATEMGYPVVLYTWFGFLAPKGTPKEVITTLTNAIEKITREDSVFIEERLSKISQVLGFLNAEEFGKQIKTDIDVVKVIVKDINEKDK